MTSLSSKMYNQTYPYDLLSREMFSTKLCHSLFCVITFSLKYHTFYIILKLHGNAFCFWIAWVPYVFTSFSNLFFAFRSLFSAWVPYVFTSFSNYIYAARICGYAWVPYVFTSFSNSSQILPSLPLLEYHTFLHHSQTKPMFTTNLNALEYHTFLHHSQTHRDSQNGRFWLEYHTFLHHSQTRWVPILATWRLEYHTFLHHSQTSWLTTARCRSLSTIRFYIILKPTSLMSGSATAWVPYVFTSFSNRGSKAIWRTKAWVPYVFTSFSNDFFNFFADSQLEYHTFLHHSQTVN